ncbi:MAG: DUF7269 family protein [Halobacteriota archaeon]
MDRETLLLVGGGVGVTAVYAVSSYLNLGFLPDGRAHYLALTLGFVAVALGYGLSVTAYSRNSDPTGGHGDEQDVEGGRMPRYDLPFEHGDASLPTVGGEVDGPYDRATDYDRSYNDRRRARQEVTEQLRDAAALHIAWNTDVDVETATAEVERGTWTEDPRASGLLSTEAGVPLKHRLYDVLLGRDPFERAVEAVVEEFEPRGDGWR